MTIDAAGFGDVKEMADGILSKMHFDHVSQKELSCLLKWACFNPYERLREPSAASGVTQPGPRYNHELSEARYAFQPLNT